MTFNPRGVFFWTFLAGAVTCGAVAWGPTAGAAGFIALAIGILVFS